MAPLPLRLGSLCFVALLHLSSALGRRDDTLEAGNVATPNLAAATCGRDNCVRLLHTSCCVPFPRILARCFVGLLLLLPPFPPAAHALHSFDVNRAAPSLRSQEGCKTEAACAEAPAVKNAAGAAAPVLLSGCVWKGDGLSTSHHKSCTSGVNGATPTQSAKDRNPNKITPAGNNNGMAITHTPRTETPRFRETAADPTMDNHLSDLAALGLKCARNFCVGCRSEEACARAPATASDTENPACVWHGTEGDGKCDHPPQQVQVQNRATYTTDKHEGVDTKGAAVAEV